MNRYYLVVFFLSLFWAVALSPQAAIAAETDRSLSLTDVPPSHPLYSAYQRYRVQQKMGMAFLGSGFGVALVGAGISYASPWGAAGIAGMTTVGVGLASMTTGMCFLAFSRLAWQSKWRRLPGVLFYRDRESTIVGFQGTF